MGIKCGDKVVIVAEPDDMIEFECLKPPDHDKEPFATQHGGVVIAADGRRVALLWPVK